MAGDGLGAVGFEGVLGTVDEFIEPQYFTGPDGFVYSVLSNPQAAAGKELTFDDSIHNGVWPYRLFNPNLSL